MANATAIDYCGVGETCYDLLPIRIRHYHHVNEQSIGVLSLLANSCLIALLMTERNRELRAYSRILLQNCVVDMAYTIALFLTEYQMEIVEGRCLLVYNGFLRHIPADKNFLLCFLACEMNTLSVLVIPIIFVFRYQLIVKGHLMRPMELVAAFSVSLTSSLFLSLMLTLSTLHTDEAERTTICNRLLRHPIWHQEGDPTINKCLHSRADNPFLITFFFGSVVIDTIAYVIMSYCSVVVIRTMRQTQQRKTFSDKTARMQQQMNIMLVVQMIIPVFVAVTPVLIICGSSILRVTIPGAGIAASMAFAWIPLMSPCTTILMVSNFRKRLFRTASMSNNRRYNIKSITIQ